MTYETTREMTRDEASGSSRVVRVPADVNRPDTLLAGLTARQLLILAAVAAALYGGWVATRTMMPPVVAVAVAVPVAGAAFALVTLRRDGIGVDQLAMAAVRFLRSPRRLAPQPARPMPAWVDAPRQPEVAPLRLPATGIDSGAHGGDGGGGGVEGAGVLDLGSDGAAVVSAATTVNLGLRTPAEQDALMAGYGAWLNSLSGPVQVLVRADRIDLEPLVAQLEDRAADLADPALEAAALAHAEFLADLAAGRDLLRRQILLVIREPLPPGVAGRGGRQAARARAEQRAVATAAALATVGIRVAVLDAAAAAAVLATAAEPTRPLAPAGLSAPDTTVTGPPLGGRPFSGTATPVADGFSWR